MKKNNDNNSDLTLQICSNDSEAIDAKSFEEELYDAELYGEELQEEEVTDTNLTDADAQFLPTLDFFSAREELIYNGGFEEFECGVPEGWKTLSPCAVSQVTAPGRVHSGNSCVGLSDCAKLRQIIKREIEANHCYQLSCFAQLQGTNAGFAVEVTFLKRHEEIAGGCILVRGQDIPNCQRQFGFYTLITSRAPRGVTGVIIEFSVNTTGCQCVCFDDVSFAEQ